LAVVLGVQETTEGG